MLNVVSAAKKIRSAVANAPVAIRSQRTAAAAASRRISEQVMLEQNGDSGAIAVATVQGGSKSSILRFGTGESQSVLAGVLKQVPAELLDVQQAGQLRNPEWYTAGPPKRDASTRALHFAYHQDFRPNMTPSEVLQEGAFGFVE